MTTTGRDVLIGREETNLLSSAQSIPDAREQDWPFFARPGIKRFIFLAADVLSLVLANAAAAAFVNGVFHIPPEASNPYGYWFLVVPFFATILYLFGGYGRLDLRRPERELELAFKAITLSFLGLLAANALIFKNLAFSRHLIVVWYFLALLFLVGARWAARTFYAQLWKNGAARSRALVIGDANHIVRYRQLLALQRHHVYDIVGAISSNGHEPGKVPATDFPLLGNLSHWEEIVRRQNVRLVVLSLPNSGDGQATLRRIIDKCCELKVDVEVFADIWNPQDFNYDFDGFTGSFRFSSKAQWPRDLQRLCKMGIDLIFGIIGSFVTLLITPIVALLINLEDRGPVFHRREFVDSDGSVRYYLKFRTMVREADRILQDDPDLRARFLGNHKLREDPRILRVGQFLRKYSIDEFPQFFSLLGGRLTLVGPRVIAHEEKNRYGELLGKRLSVKPGITGYWQVMGRQMTTYDERIEMDMFYIDHWSIWLDLFIIAKTFSKIVWPEGAY
jgi:exopolysaccharide biosynthesis polyprenyl glycosylphosphotransferase